MSDNLLQSVDNALSLLELFAEDDSELGVSAISRKLGLSKSTVFRLLTTLESRNFITQNIETSKYRLGIKIANLGAKVLQKMNIIQECKPFLEGLTHTTGESTHLAIYNQGYITFIDKVKGSNPSLMTSVIGYQLPAYLTGTGKVLLAYLSPEEQNNFFQSIPLKKKTPYSITSKEELKKELEEIRLKGFASDQQESEEGLVCFAAPIRDGTGNVAAAVSVSGAASRMNNNSDYLIKLVKETANKISKACGWSPDYKWK